MKRNRRPTILRSRLVRTRERRRSRELTDRFEKDVHVVLFEGNHRHPHLWAVNARIQINRDRLDLLPPARLGAVVAGVQGMVRAMERPMVMEILHALADRRQRHRFKGTRP